MFISLQFISLRYRTAAQATLIKETKLSHLLTLNRNPTWTRFSTWGVLFIAFHVTGKYQLHLSTKSYSEHFLINWLHESIFPNIKG